MHQIDVLYDKGRYEEALEIAKGSEDPHDVGVGVSSLIALGRRQEALDMLLSRRKELFSHNPLLCMKADFELRFALEQFDEAYDDLSYFNNLPYVSQQVEEALREYPKKIREEEKAYLIQGKANGDNLDELLSCSDPYAVLGALSKIGNERLEGYESKIAGLLASSQYHDVKVFALEVLVSLGYGKEVTFADGGEKRKVRPSELVSPFAEKNYQSLRTMLGTLKDSSLQRVCISLLDQIAMSSFPDYPFKGATLSTTLDALLSLGNEYLGGKEAAEGKSAEEKSRLKAILAKHPPLP